MFAQDNINAVCSCHFRDTENKNNALWIKKNRNCLVNLKKTTQNKIVILL